ncbi:MAG: molybdopterin-dependent oxidoreductase [Microthrixaceae bacterium]
MGESVSHGGQRRTAASRREQCSPAALGAGFALATGELVSAALDAAPSPLLAVGGRFIDRFAGSLKDLAVAVFGTNDKPALVAGTIVITVLLGAASGHAALRRPWVPWATFGAFGVFGAWAQATDERVGTFTALVVCVVSVLAGVGATAGLLVAGRLQTHPPALDEGVGAPERSQAIEWSRRRFALASGGLLVVSAGFVAAGRALTQGDVIAAARAIPLPRPIRRRALPGHAGQAEAGRAGVSPYVTPNADFYRIDTALSSPLVDVADWRLRIGGLVEHPFLLSYEELLSLDSVEEAVTLQCVSNEVGGDLVGNAVWQGVPLLTLLDRAGVRASAEQVFSTSVDGWTCGFPLSVLDGDRPALVAYAMNGERLPVRHGFPARLVVSGLYGYVSATKWLTEVELTTWDGADGYWVPARLVEDGADQAGLPHRRAVGGDDDRTGPHRVRWRGVVAGGGDLRGRGIDRRRRVGRVPARLGGQRAHVGAVDLPLDRDPGDGTRSGCAPSTPTARSRSRSRRHPRPTVPPGTTGSSSRWPDATFGGARSRTSRQLTSIVPVPQPRRNPCTTNPPPAEQ